MMRSSPTLAETVGAFDANEFVDDPVWVLRWSCHQFARNDWDEQPHFHRSYLLATSPPLVGHTGWDAFFAALADYLADRDRLPAPEWIYQPDRYNHGDVFYPGWGRVNPPIEVKAALVAENPAEWFTDRGVGLELSSLPSGHGKHIAPKSRTELHANRLVG